MSEIRLISLSDKVTQLKK